MLKRRDFVRGAIALAIATPIIAITPRGKKKEYNPLPQSDAKHYVLWRVQDKHKHVPPFTEFYTNTMPDGRVAYIAFEHAQGYHEPEYGYVPITQEIIEKYDNNFYFPYAPEWQPYKVEA